MADQAQRPGVRQRPAVRHDGPPPPTAASRVSAPILWGVEDHVRTLFADAADVQCGVHKAPDNVHADSVESWVDYLESTLGPAVLAKAALEPEGKWDATRADLVALFERFNEADDGSMRASPPYLLSTVVAA